MEQVRIGLIGCGGFGRWHLSHYPSIADAKIVALCDTDPLQLAETKRVHGWLADVPEFPDHGSMIAAGLVDAVLIVTPHNNHLEQIEDAFAAGLHVLGREAHVSDRRGLSAGDCRAGPLA